MQGGNCGADPRSAPDALVRLADSTDSVRLAFAFRYVPASIPRFVSLEVRTIDLFRRLRFLAALWGRPFIAVIGMQSIVHVAREIAGAMKPRARAHKAVPVKPLRSVVAGRSATIRSGVIVAIGTIRRNADFNADLSPRFGCTNRESDYGNGS